MEGARLFGLDFGRMDSGNSREEVLLAQTTVEEKTTESAPTSARPTLPDVENLERSVQNIHHVPPLVSLHDRSLSSGSLLIQPVSSSILSPFAAPHRH